MKTIISISLLSAALCAHADTALKQSAAGVTELNKKCEEIGDRLIPNVLISKVSTMNIRGSYAGMFISINYADGTRNVFNMSPSTDMADLPDIKGMQKLAELAYLNQAPVTLCVARTEGFNSILPVMGIQLD